MSVHFAALIEEQLELLRVVRDLPFKDEPRDRLAHDSAQYALDIGLSCSTLLADKHLVAFHILLRSITESMLKLAWGLQSEQNAISLETSAHNEFRKNLTSLIKDGALSIQNPTDGSSLDQTLLDLAQVDPKHRPTNVREIAKALGLELFYQLLYKNLSMQTHGSYSVVSSSQPRTLLEDRAKALLGGLETVKIISAKWLALRELVDPASLQAVLLPGQRP